MNTDSKTPGFCGKGPDPGTGGLFSGCRGDPIGAPIPLLPAV